MLIAKTLNLFSRDDARRSGHVMARHAPELGQTDVYLAAMTYELLLTRDRRPKLHADVVGSCDNQVFDSTSVDELTTRISDDNV
jgi:hypothetical protein